MAITQTFDLNMIPDSAPVIVHVDQYDEGAGRLVAKLYNGSVAYTPASGATAVIQGMKPDKHGFTYSATISGNTVTANLTQQMTAAAGNVCVQLVIHEGDNRTGTFVFFLAVQRSALPANSDLSQSDLEYIEELIADAEALTTQVPYIGANGNWWIWSSTAHAYVDSGVDASITITIGTTSTLPAGSSATVSNSGTPTDPIFNFGIPMGYTGATGATGADGDDGFSPYVTLGTKVGRDQPVTITDAEGDHTFHIYDGQDGAGAGVYPGTCTTAGETAAKEITVDNSFSLRPGVVISVKFSNTNTANNPTLDVNGTGAKSIWYSTTLITTSNSSRAGQANFYENYVYDGTYWVWFGHSADENTTYSPPKLGIGYGTCDTAAATVEKSASMTNYGIVTGGFVAIKFTNAVPANATLSINHLGARSIYYKGAAITDGVIKAGDIATFVYSTYYHLIAIDTDVDKHGTMIDKTMQEYQALTPEQQADPDTYYWIDDDPGIDYDNIRDIVAPTEYSTAVGGHSTGDEFILGDYLYKAISAIAQGDPIVTSGTGQNAALAGTIVDQIKALFDDEIFVKRTTMTNAATVDLDNAIDNSIAGLQIATVGPLVSNSAPTSRWSHVLQVMDSSAAGVQISIDTELLSIWVRYKNSYWHAWKQIYGTATSYYKQYSSTAPLTINATSNSETIFTLPKGMYVLEITTWSNNISQIDFLVNINGSRNNGNAITVLNNTPNASGHILTCTADTNLLTLYNSANASKSIDNIRFQAVRVAYY